MRIFNIIPAFLLVAQGLSYAQTAGQKDSLVTLPYGVVKSYDNTTGKAISISGDELRKLPSGDLRNRLNGMVPGLNIKEYGGGIFRAATGGFTDYDAAGTSNTLTLNGFTSMKVLVDDIPIPFNQLLLEPNQIKSVTVLSDALDKTKAGPMGASGALSIRTARGEYNTPLKITVDAGTGVNFIDLLPEWASGTEYARLNNISREAAGLDPLYSDEAIAAFGKYNSGDLRYPAVNYREKMLNDAFMSTTFGLSATAGSNNIKYHLALNGLNTGDLINAEKTDYNRLNITSNITTRVNSYIEASVGFMGLLSFRRQPNISWYNYRSVPEIAYPLILGKVGTTGATDEDISTMTGQTIYGVSKVFTANYYAKLLEGGRQTVRNRSGMFYANVDVDFAWLLKGLKSKTSVLTSSFLSTTVGKSNDYIAYYWDVDLGVQEISTHKGVKETSRSKSDDATSATLSFHERLYYDWNGNGHDIDAGVTYYQSNSAQTGDSYYQRLQYLEGDASWSYSGRYNLEVAAQYAGSSRFKKGARWGFFPSAGVSWIVSNEEFLRGNRTLTRLKLHAQAADMPSASLFGSPYLYQAVYTLSSSSVDYGPARNAGLQWFGSNSYTAKTTTLSRFANPELTWQRIGQLGGGIDIGLFGSLTLSADIFRWQTHDFIADVLSNTPEVYGITATVYDNYESDVSQGVNFAVGYNNRWGDFRIDTWASASTWNRKYNVRLYDNYLYDYQKLTGTSTTAIRGFECIGRYASAEEIANLPSYVDKASLQVGDLKYRDQNDDGVIDSNDRIVIGDTTPKICYNLNISLEYKDFDVRIVGTGRAGEDFDLTYSTYFTGATGMDNQSKFVLNELGKDIPRINYYGTTNNNPTSTFWLRKRNWFKIKALTAGYTLRFKQGNHLGAESLRLEFKCSNLLTITNLKYIDPEDSSAGLSRYPYFKTVSLGAMLSF